MSLLSRIGEVYTSLPAGLSGDAPASLSLLAHDVPSSLSLSSLARKGCSSSFYCTNHTRAIGRPSSSSSLSAHPLSISEEMADVRMEMGPGGSLCVSCAGVSSQNTAEGSFPLVPSAPSPTPLADALLLFFQFYGSDLDTRQWGLSVRGRGAVFRKVDRHWYNESNPDLFALEDPQSMENDVGRGIFDIYRVRSELQLASLTLQGILAGGLPPPPSGTCAVGAIIAFFFRWFVWLMHSCLILLLLILFPCLDDFALLLFFVCPGCVS